MSDYTPVKELLGQCAFQLIHDRATTMKTQELQEFALQIGNVPNQSANRVFGKFQQRCERPASIDAAAQMRQILAD